MTIDEARETVTDIVTLIEDIHTSDLSTGDKVQLLGAIATAAGSCANEHLDAHMRQSAELFTTRRI